MIERALNLPEGIENMCDHFRIDADPAVPDLQHNVVALYVRRHPNAAAWLHVLGGILHEVREYLLQPDGVRVHGHRLWRQGNFNLVAARFEGRTYCLDR